MYYLVACLCGLWSVCGGIMRSLNLIPLMSRTGYIPVELYIQNIKLIIMILYSYT